MNAQYHTKSKKLNIIERTKIELLYNQDKSQSYIARELGWSKSTISCEIRLGTYKGQYQAHIAQMRSDKARARCGRKALIQNTDLMYEIERLFKDGTRPSPEIIANLLKGRISHTTIYTLCHTKRSWWHKYLIYQKKSKYHKGLAGKSLIPNRVDISMRPEIEFGDWEADTVVPARGGKACLGVFVEKTTRLYKVVKMMNKTADEMLRASLVALDGLPVRSITYDNGLENATHECTNRLLGCVSWFCRAYCSTDKPQIENRNKLLRLWLPKKTTFDFTSEEEIARIETAINNRPMQCLEDANGNWLAPSQAFGLNL